MLQNSPFAPNQTAIDQMFSGRPLLIATMHGKEKVIGPVLENAIGIKPVKCDGFDTDRFGTFTGEIVRENNAFNSARIKCLEAMQIIGIDLCIASEGSFGPHPEIPFIAADEEILVFMDLKNQLEISVRHIDCETNFRQSEIDNFDDLKKFALDTGFPEHGIIFRKDSFSKNTIHKDCMDWRDLKILFDYYKNKFGSFTVETDMRAMRNPTRMKVIERATEKLKQKLMSLCPNCSRPGYSAIDVVRGLPCQQCLFPTRTIKYFIYQCPGCGHKENIQNRDKTYEDPMYCDICNP